MMHKKMHKKNETFPLPLSHLSFIKWEMLSERYSLSFNIYEISDNCNLNGFSYRTTRAPDSSQRVGEDGMLG